MASPVANTPFDHIHLLVASFKQTMATKKGPIAPSLTDEKIAAVFEYGRKNFSQVEKKAFTLLHLRPSETGLARSVTWFRNKSNIDLFVHCNKVNERSGGDQPLCSGPGNSEKQLSYAFSSLTREIFVSAAIKCFDSDRMDVAFASKRVSYALELQTKCAVKGGRVSPISPLDFYPIKPKIRQLPRTFIQHPTHKLRFMMRLATCDLYSSNISALSFFKRFQVARSILTAIKGMHDSGVAHCDLKPENFLLFGGWEYLLVTDLGAAIKEEDAGKGICQHITPRFTDPEALSEKSPSFEALKALDVWQAALILAEIFFAQPMYELVPESHDQDTTARLLHLLRSLTPKWYSETFTGVLKKKYTHDPRIEPLIALLDRMLHPKRSERPGIHECLLIIETLLQSFPPESVSS